jgi:hypothetical protein
LLNSYHVCGLLNSYHVCGLLNSYHVCGLLNSYHVCGLLNSYHACGLYWFSDTIGKYFNLDFCLCFLLKLLRTVVKKALVSSFVVVYNKNILQINSFTSTKCYTTCWVINLKYIHVSYKVWDGILSPFI